MNSATSLTLALDALAPHGSGRQLLFLSVVALCLLAALRLARRAMVPLTSLLRPLAAVAGSIIALVAALVFVVLAALADR